VADGGDAGDRLYTMASAAPPAAADDDADAPTGTEDVLCLDARDGRTLWRTALGPRFEDSFGNGPRMTPSVDGGTLYAITSSMHLGALDAATGAIRWQRDLTADFGAPVPRFGYASSPLVVGDLLIVDVGAVPPEDDAADNDASGDDAQPSGGVIAFDKTDGRVRWTALAGPAGHVSPVYFAQLAGRDQIVTFRGLAGAAEGRGMVGLDPATGDVLWAHPVENLDTIVPPLRIGDDQLFSSSGTIGNGGYLIRLVPRASDVPADADSDASVGHAYTVETLWTQRRMRTHFNPAVVRGAHLYGFDNGTLRALDLATGELRWAQRGFGKGSLIASGDRLVVLGDTGQLALVAVDPDGYAERGRVQAMTGRSWTAPTLARGRLYVRDHDEIVAYRVTGTADAAAARTAARIDAPTASAADSGDRDALPTLETVLAGYAKARGGRDAWRAAHTLAIEGTQATFSQIQPMTLVRRRGAAHDHFVMTYDTLGGPLKMAQDEHGPWWIFTLFQIAEPARINAGPYRALVQRRAHFEPLLLDPAARDLRVTLLGRDAIDGRETLALEVVWPAADPATGMSEPPREVWHLDPATYREIAIDGRVSDFTQGQQPMDLRTYFSDFRTIDGGLVVPFNVVREFGARFEEMAIAQVRVNPDDVNDAIFAGPAPAADAPDDGDSEESADG
ncbi:MAG: PQQ-binding-like beta-propeller repeat protein, partial [Acidobacteriota bacterium]